MGWTNLVKTVVITFNGVNASEQVPRIQGYKTWEYDKKKKILLTADQLAMNQRKQKAKARLQLIKDPNRNLKISGMLLDLDYAKSTTKTKTVPSSTSSKSSHLKLISEDLHVSEDVALQALRFCRDVGEALVYTAAAKRANVLKLNVEDVQHSVREMVSKTTGVLIDLDHAKSTTTTTTVTSSASFKPSHPKFISEDLHVSEDVALQALRFRPDLFHAGCYVKAAQEGNVLKLYVEDVQHSLREMASKTTGVLIDLDHAKSTTTTTTVPSSTSPIDPPHLQYISWSCNVTEDAAIQALTSGLSSRKAVGYVEAAQEANVLKSDVGRTWSSKDLGWKDIGELPDFQSHQPDRHERTGTLPFMSHVHLDFQDAYSHDAIHDMESFWWILVYLCLTRKSGGGHRRDDITDQLKTLVETLFETESPRVMYSEKSRYFRKHDDTPFKTLLKAHVHDYFEPLKSLLTRWRDVLILGYEYKAYEYYLIHDYIVAIIDDTLKDPDLVTYGMISKTTGVLIDLDHAKSTTKTTTVPSSTSPIDPLDQQDISRRRSVTEDVAIQALTSRSSFSEAIGYVKAAQERNVLKLDVGRTWSSKDLGWKEIGEIPDFQSHQPDKHERTGTLPFMSYQLLNPHGLYPHSAIHDMESFWWILVYLCLTRKSGGGHRRDDITEQLQTLVERLFETESLDVIYSEKSCYFQKKRDAPFKALLKAYVHDYFEPLKSLLTRWRDVLILGYEYEAYEYHLVHDYIVAIIDDTLKDPDLVTHASDEDTKRGPLSKRPRKENSSQQREMDFTHRFLEIMPRRQL